MLIRFAKKEDLNQIIKLCELHAEYEKANYDSSNKQALLQEQLFKESSSVKCLVVDINSDIVGYATFMKQFSTWDANFYIYLDCLYFKEEIRGSGLGIQIMAIIKDYAITEDCEIIQWQTPDFNKKAISFYQKMGAISKTKERFYWNV